MTLAREYVWGPGDWGGGGVDELLVQFDAGRRATWPILDSGGNVLALCDLGSAGNSARVLTRIVYDAYGRVIGRSDPATPATGPPELRVGHKGLFFDRLDWGIVDPLTFEETPRLEPGARLIGYNRNRSVHVGWGRFLQRDPNATGLPVQAGLGFHGDGFDASVQGFDLAVHYGDGVNVYEYIGSDPLGGGDPTGLMEFSLGGQMATMAINAWDMAEGTLETAATGIRGGLGLAVMAMDHNLNMMFDFEWASDWGASDDDYSGGFRIDEAAAASGSTSAGFATAATWRETNTGLKGVFGANNEHGGARHYTRMRLETLRYIHTNGLRLSDVEFKINRTSAGLSRMRPDVTIVELKTGKTLVMIEVSNSQSTKGLENKVDKLKNATKASKTKVTGFSLRGKLRI